MNPQCHDGVCSLPVAAPPPIDVATGGTFEAEVLRAPMPVLVDVAAAWCGPCGLLAPILPKLAAEFRGRLRILRVDGDAEPVLAAARRIEAYPTLLLFDRGVEIARRRGFVIADYPALRAWVAAAVTDGHGAPAPPLAGEAAFAAAIAAAATAHDAVMQPLLAAAVAAQEPHLPAFRAALAEARAEREAGRIGDDELQRRRDAASRRLRERTGPARAALEAAGGPADAALRLALERATAAFVMACAG